jgi:hypothetical protein
MNEENEEIDLSDYSLEEIEEIFNQETRNGYI